MSVLIHVGFFNIIGGFSAADVISQGHRRKITNVQEKQVQVVAPETLLVVILYSLVIFKMSLHICSEHAVFVHGSIPPKAVCPFHDVSLNQGRKGTFMDFPEIDHKGAGLGCCP